MTAPTGPAAGPTAATSDTAWFALTPDEAASQLGVDPAVGLASAEVETRRTKYGKNSFAEAKKASRWQMFVRQYADPMQIVLLIAGIVCLFLPGQFYTGIFLILLTMFNAWMAMNQEGKAEASASALASMMVVKAKVRRGGELIEVPMEDLVPGDIVNIEAGDLVPADGRLLTAATLEIDESALTGESAYQAVSGVATVGAAAGPVGAVMLSSPSSTFLRPLQRAPFPQGRQRRRVVPGPRGPPWRRPGRSGPPSRPSGSGG